MSDLSIFDDIWIKRLKARPKPIVHGGWHIDLPSHDHVGFAAYAGNTADDPTYVIFAVVTLEKSKWEGNSIAFSQDGAVVGQKDPQWLQKMYNNLMRYVTWPMRQGRDTYSGMTLLLYRIPIANLENDYLDEKDLPPFIKQVSFQTFMEKVMGAYVWHKPSIKWDSEQAVKTLEQLPRMEVYKPVF
jgi:hypothetical protein